MSNMSVNIHRTTKLEICARSLSTFKAITITGTDTDGGTHEVTFFTEDQQLIKNVQTAIGAGHVTITSEAKPPWDSRKPGVGTPL